MIKKNNIPQIRAELLLNYLYPEDWSKWIARGEGTFYRNYNYDLLSIDNEKMEAQTSRDGFLSLLPPGMITEAEDLKGEDAGEKYKEMKRRIRLLKEAFMPLDSFTFRRSVYVEHVAAEMLQDRLDYVLRTYFDFDLEQEPSELVRQAAVILPFVSKKRGDFGFVANLLSALLHCEVRIETGRYSAVDSSRYWVPRIRFELLMPGLTPEAFRELDQQVEPLRHFIREWLMPFEMVSEFVIKEHHVDQQTNTRLTLGYNTEVNQ